MSGTETDVPAAVRADVRAVVSALPPGDGEYIRGLPGADLSRLHRTLGHNLRNAFRAGRYPHLFGYCSGLETAETRSFDNISETATRLVWGHLRAVPKAEPGGVPSVGGSPT